MQDKTEWIRAGFGPRAAAFLLDQLLVGLALLVVKIPAWLVRLYAGQPVGNVLFSFTLLDVLCYLLLSAYFVLLTYVGGSTLGKKVMGLRVVREDGADLRFVDVLYRETVGRYLSGVLCLGYLMALVDRRKRGFHDYLCETCVVCDHKKEKEPAAPAAGGGVSAPVYEAPAPAPVLLGYTVPGEAQSVPGAEASGAAASGAAAPAAAEETSCEDEAVNVLPPAEREKEF